MCVSKKISLADAIDLYGVYHPLLCESTKYPVSAFSLDVCCDWLWTFTVSPFTEDGKEMMSAGCYGVWQGSHQQMWFQQCWSRRSCNAAQGLPYCPILKNRTLNRWAGRLESQPFGQPQLLQLLVFLQLMAPKDSPALSGWQIRALSVGKLTICFWSLSREYWGGGGRLRAWPFGGQQSSKSDGIIYTVKCGPSELSCVVDCCNTLLI